MKIGDKIILKDLQDIFGNTEWTVEKCFKVATKHYYLISPNNKLNNKMVVNEDKSVVITDVEKQWKDVDIYYNIKYELKEMEELI